MSAPYSMPALLPSPPTEQPSSSAPAQSANRTTSSLHPMSISSLITTDLPGTPPDSRGSSSETNHATQAPLVPPSESITSPVNDSALTVTDTEALTAAEQLYSMRSQNDANEHNESITAPTEDEPLNSAPINSLTATVKDKGKGKDPELYDISPPEDGNSQDCQVDRSATHNEAENRLQVPAIEIEIDLALSLLDLGVKRYECNTCLDGDPTLCSQCLTVPWRQVAHHGRPVFPSPVIKYEPNLYSSDSGDEGPRLCTARPVSPSPVIKYEPNLYSSDSEDEGPPLSKIRFNPSCHGNCLQLSAQEGNAVFDLLPQRKQRHDSRHHGLGARNGGMRCRRCELVQAHTDDRYGQRYKVREYKRFERGDTVPLDDDAVDSTASERLGAAEYNDDKNHSAMSSNPLKLSRKTIRRLEAEKRKWKPEPISLTATPSDAPVSVADAVEPTRLPRYPKRSATRSSVTPSASINPETRTAQLANESPRPPPPLSDNKHPHTRPTPANRQSSASNPSASNYIDLATSTSSPYPYSPPTNRHAQRQNLKPFTPSPLKHAQSASANWEIRDSQQSSSKQQLHTPPHPLPTTMTMYNDDEAVFIGTQAFGTQSQRGGNNGRGTTNWFAPLPVKYIYGSIVQPDEERHEAYIPLTPPSSGRKRKAAAMQRTEVQGEGVVEWQGKKFKGRAVLSMERERMRDALFALHAVGE